MSFRVPRSKSSLRFVGGCSIRKDREGTVTVSWPGTGVVKKKEVGYWRREVLVRVHVSVLSSFSSLSQSIFSMQFQRSHVKVPIYNPYVDGRCPLWDLQVKTLHG